MDRTPHLRDEAARVARDHRSARDPAQEHRDRLRCDGLGAAAGAVFALLATVSLAGVVVGALLLAHGRLLGVVVLVAALVTGWAARP